MEGTARHMEAIPVRTHLWKLGYAVEGRGCPTGRVKNWAVGVSVGIGDSPLS